ncbi:hypothetical protein KBD34_04460 [Patescibacteria group bacterium]|nr:hypothetical protein [Patescibacteria group bacterium]
MTLGKKTILTSVLVGSMLVGATVFASMYEWFDGGTIHNLTVGTSTFQPGGTRLGTLPGDSLLVKYRVHTSAPFQENRSVYIVSSTSTGDTYVEIPSCRRNSVVGNITDESCDLTYSTTGGNSHTVRVTTNYAGCGSYTPTPDADCGDVLDFPLTWR